MRNDLLQSMEEVKRTGKQTCQMLKRSYFAFEMSR